MDSFGIGYETEESEELRFEEEKDKLDSAFKSCIADLKPFVLSLPLKEERQRIARWIKKLCSFPGPKLRDRKNRNLYGKLLLLMLRKGALDAPFLEDPKEGPLQTIPAYMSRLLEESLNNQHTAGSKEKEYLGPEWLHEELPSSDSLFEGRKHVDKSYSAPSPHRRNYDRVKGRRRQPLSQRRFTEDRHDYLTSNRGIDVSSESESYALEESDSGKHEVGFKELKTPPRSHVRRNHSSGPAKERSQRLKEVRVRGSRSQKQYESQILPRPIDYSGYSSGSAREEKENLRQDKEVDLKLKMLEAKFEEERLTLQQKHDLAVRKILDRKNSELDEIKTYYKEKINLAEELNKKLEKKVLHLNKEVSIVKERSDQEIEELKQTIQQNLLIAQHDKEREVNETIAAFEQEKFDMQKHHSRAIQELTDEHTDHLKRLESEYENRLKSSASVIQSLEGKCKQQSQDMDVSESKLNRLNDERVEFQDKISRLSQESEKFRTAVEVLENENRKLIDDHDNVIRELRKKTDQTINDMKKESSSAASKATEMIADMESKVSHYKQALQEFEFQSKKETRELEATHKQELMKMEVLYDKKFRTLQREKEDMEADHRCTVQRLEMSIRDKDDKLDHLNLQLKEQGAQAEVAINDFKQQAEEKSRKMFEEMSEQIGKLESELSRTKQLKEIQLSDLKRQLETEKSLKESGISELKEAYEEERAMLVRNHASERDSQIQEHQQDTEMLVNKYEGKLLEKDEKLRALQDEKTKTVTQLESEVRELREEVIQANNLRKQQLIELGLLRDEEKQNAKRQEEMAQAKFRSQVEQQRLQLQKEHNSEMDKLLNTTNSKLKEIESEYEGRLGNAETTIVGLQTQITTLQENCSSLQLTCDSKLAELSDKHATEKEAMKRQHANAIKSLNQDVELYKIKSKQLERKCQHLELEKQEKISNLQLNYEEKIKGLLPTAVQEELECTIESLKEQVTVLQARIEILQDDSESTP